MRITLVIKAWKKQNKTKQKKQQQQQQKLQTFLQSAKQ